MNGQLPVTAVCIGLMLTGCPSSSDTASCLAPDTSHSEILTLDLIAVGLDGTDTRVVGRPNAADPAASLRLNGDAVPIAEDGSFDTSLDGVLEEVEFTVSLNDLPSEVHSFRVRTVHSALACSVGSVLTTGTLPNDVETIDFCTDDNSLTALITLTGDAGLDIVNLNTADRLPNAPYFAPIDGVVASEPFAVARSTDLGVVAVTLRGQGTTALVDPCIGHILDIAAPSTSNATWLSIDVEPAVTLREPRDVDGDGIEESEVSRMRVSGPQAAVFSGDRLWVAYTNILQPALDEERPMKAGLGALMVFDVDGDALLPAGYRVLPSQNPQGLIADHDGGVWVSHTGTFSYQGARLVAGSDGALVHVTADLLIDHVIDAKRFAPSTPALIGDQIIVGSMLEGAIIIMKTDATSIDDGVRLSLTQDEGINTVFEAVPLPGNLVGLVHFERDELRIIDLETMTLDPWPFTSPILLADDGTAFRGAGAVTFTRWQGAALLLLSAEIVSLDLRQMMGP